MTIAEMNVLDVIAIGALAGLVIAYLIVSAESRRSLRIYRNLKRLLREEGKTDD